VRLLEAVEAGHKDYEYLVKRSIKTLKNVTGPLFSHDHFDRIVFLF
jgi:hypothetical protein